MKRSKEEWQNAIIKGLEAVEKQIECPICLSVVEDAMIIPVCQHRFCRGCITSSLRKCKNECPSCRVPIASRRSLRDDVEFGNMVQTISSTSMSIRDEFKKESLVAAKASLQTLTKHFVCPLCNEDLKGTYVSSECMHRFCSKCVFQLKSLECPCCNIADNGNAASKELASATLDHETSSSIFRNKTTFHEDKQLDEVIASVGNILKLLSEAIEFYQPDTCKTNNESEIVASDEEDIICIDVDECRKVEGTEDEKSILQEEGNDEVEEDEEVEVDMITLDDPYSHMNHDQGDGNGEDDEDSSLEDDEIVVTPGLEEDHYSSSQYDKEEVDDDDDCLGSYVQSSQCESDNLDRKQPGGILKNNPRWAGSTPPPSRSGQVRVKATKRVSFQIISQYDETDKKEIQVSNDCNFGDNTMNEERSDAKTVTLESESDDHDYIGDEFVDDRTRSDDKDDTVEEAEPKSIEGDGLLKDAGQNGGDEKSEEEGTKESNLKQRDIEAKFPIGTQFIGDVHDPSIKKYGRIVGFDGDMYQVYYPQDKSIDSLREADFDKVKLIQKSNHARPSKRTQASKVNQPCCPKCTRPFSSEMYDASKANIPVQSTNCSHVICVDCVHALRMSNAEQGNGRIRDTVDCPICGNKQSFNGLNPTISVSTAQMVGLYNEMKTTQFPSPTLSSPTKPILKRPLDEVEHEPGQQKSYRDVRQKKPRKNDEKDAVDCNMTAIGKKDVAMHLYNEECNHDIGSSHNGIDRIPENASKDLNDMSHDRRIRYPSHEKQGSSRKKMKTKKKEEKGSVHKAKCTSCKRYKPSDKFSSKQQERNKLKKAKVLCRRCEEKAIMQARWGRDAIETCITLSISKGKYQSSDIKFLASLVPWRYGRVGKKKVDLPSELVLDGYTRDSFGRLSNEDIEQEQLWIKSKFWATGEGITRFLNFLKDEGKSAFGSFVLSDGRDGFFVLPFDQEVVRDTEDRAGKATSPIYIICFKYIIGLDILGGEESCAETNDTNVDEAQAPQKEDIDFSGMKPSILTRLLSAQSETDNCLTQVPKGSVKAVQTATSTIPSAPQHSKPTDWFRGGTVIIEEGDRPLRSKQYDDEADIDDAPKASSTCAKSEMDKNTAL